jgi:hypothetical protein
VALDDALRMVRVRSTEAQRDTKAAARLGELAVGCGELDSVVTLQHTHGRQRSSSSWAGRVPPKLVLQLRKDRLQASRNVTSCADKRRSCPPRTVVAEGKHVLKAINTLVERAKYVHHNQVERSLGTLA